MKLYHFFFFCFISWFVSQDFFSLKKSSSSSSLKSLLLFFSCGFSVWVSSKNVFKPALLELKNFNIIYICLVSLKKRTGINRSEDLNRPDSPLNT